MKKRLRKKLAKGEFQRYGVGISFLVSKSSRSDEEIIDEIIEKIEKYKMRMTGSIQGNEGYIYVDLGEKEEVNINYEYLLSSLEEILEIDQLKPDGISKD